MGDLLVMLDRHFAVVRSRKSLGVVVEMEIRDFAWEVFFFGRKDCASREDYVKLKITSHFSISNLQVATTYSFYRLWHLVSRIASSASYNHS
jgi:hypothetical protein